MVAVETYIDVGNILWIFYDCLSTHQYYVGIQMKCNINHVQQKNALITSAQFMTYLLTVITPWSIIPTIFFLPVGSYASLSVCLSLCLFRLNQRSGHKSVSPTPTSSCILFSQNFQHVIILPDFFLATFLVGIVVIATAYLKCLMRACKRGSLSGFPQEKI